MALVDKESRVNILHWSSIKCKRITGSVLALELFAMVHGFGTGAAVKMTIAKVLQIQNIYDCLVKLGTAKEKRLMIDHMCLRQSYERREIAVVKWIDGDSNPADAMTKSTLEDLIDNNIVKLHVTEWVERTRKWRLGLSCDLE